MRNLFIFSILAFTAFTTFTAFPVFAASTITQQAYGTMQSIHGIAGNGDALVAVGNTGNRMRSIDGGTTWTLLSNTGSAWWHDVDAAADGDFLAVGDSGVYATSEDDGATWTSSSLGVTATLYDIDRTSSSTGYVVGAGGTAVYYANGNWFSGTPNVTETLYAVQDNGDGTAWVVGGAGRLLRASNNGISWTNYGRIGSENLWGVYFGSSSTGWIVGENGTFKKTTDGGVGWTNVDVSGLVSQDLYDIQVSGDLMFVVGDTVIFVSEDGGDTWLMFDYTSEMLTFHAAYVQDSQDAWFAGTDFDVYSTIYHWQNVEEVVEEEPIEEEPVEEEVQTQAEPGNLVKLACEGETDVDDPCRAVYYYATDGMRHAFPNEKVFFTWFEDFDDVIEVSADFLSDLSLGANVTYHPGTKMVKFQSVNTVYAVEARSVLRAISSEEVAQDLYGETWNQRIDDISDAFYGNYEFGEDIDAADDYDPEEAENSVENLNDNF